MPTRDEILAEMARRKELSAPKQPVVATENQQQPSRNEILAEQDRRRRKEIEKIPFTS